MTDQPGAPKSPGKPVAPPMTPAQLQQMQAQQAVAAALRGNVPLIYANGFAIAQSTADMSIVLMLNGNPAAMLAMSYISVKSLISDLQKAIQNFEEASGQKIKTIAELTPEMDKKLRGANVPR